MPIRLVGIPQPIRDIHNLLHGLNLLRSRPFVSVSSAHVQILNTPYEGVNKLNVSKSSVICYKGGKTPIQSWRTHRRSRCYSTTLANKFETQQDELSKKAATRSNSVRSRDTMPQSILITGGTSGIGYQVARRAILDGASYVRIITRDARRGQTAIDQLRKETAATSDVHLDYVQAETEEYGDPKLFDHPNTNSGFTTIIHCAGITQFHRLTSTSPSAIQTILRVNLESAALLSRALLKRYTHAAISTSRKSQSSSSPSSPPNLSNEFHPQSWQFIAMSSLLAVKRGAGSAIYAASKAGLIALVRAIALEGGEVAQKYRNSGAPGFRANVVLPGYIETPMTDGFSSSAKEKLASEIPSGRFGTPEEVADAVMFLLKNEYANNCVLNLDGGLSAI